MDKDGKRDGNVTRALQILALMSAGVIAWDRPPTRAEKEEVENTLNNAEARVAGNAADIKRASELLKQLEESIEALDKTLAPLRKDTPADLIDDVAKLEATLIRLKETEKNARKQANEGTVKASALERELKSTLKAYFGKADPKMIAKRFGVDIDGIDFDNLGTAEFQNRTDSASAETPPYGVVMEHAWDSVYWFRGVDGALRRINLNGVMQHEQITTKDFQAMVKDLTRSVLPGIRPPVGRFGRVVGFGAIDKGKDGTYASGAWANLIGNESLPPAVISNSTTSRAPLDDDSAFNAQIDLFLRGKGTTTFKCDNGAEMTLGLPKVSNSIWCNSAGNDGPAAYAPFNIPNHFYPHRINWGVTAIPAKAGTNRRDDTASTRVEGYSSGAAVDLVVARPRWETDGSPIAEQWIHPDFQAIVEGNFAKLAGVKGSGKYGVPTAEEWDVIRADPAKQGLYEAWQMDVSRFVAELLRSNECDKSGRHHDMPGTSFAAPIGAGVVTAAKLLFPDASPEEIQAALYAACEPQLLREAPTGGPGPGKTLDDIAYYVDPNTGWRFAPLHAGEGEFRYDPQATEQKPDSWIRMQRYLRAMQEKRRELTAKGELTVTIGQGQAKHKAVVNGQPDHALARLPSFQSTPTQEMESRAAESEKDVLAAFNRVQECFKGPPLKEADPIVRSVRKRHYTEAIKQLKARVKTLLTLPAVAPGIVGGEIVGRVLGEVANKASATRMGAVEQAALENAERAVAMAESMKEFTYSFDMPEGQDMLLTIAAMRLKFNGPGDRHVVLESPDHRRVIVSLSSYRSDVAVGSTRGFWNQTAQGDKTELRLTEATGGFESVPKGRWKLHTRHEIGTGSTLFLYGTERNKAQGLLDVRETALLPLLAQERKQRTNLSAKNILQIANPHDSLRRMEQSLRPASKTQVSPLSFEESTEQFKHFIEHESELRKQNFIPEGELVSPSPEKPRESASREELLHTAAKHMAELYAEAHGSRQQLPMDKNELLACHWGEMAGQLARGEWQLPVTRVDPANRRFHERKRDPDVPYYERENLRFQDLAGRRRGAPRDKC